jgi:D-cysteine desulfhydrase
MDASFLQLLEYDPPEWARSVTEPPNRRLAMALTPTAIEPWRIPPNLLPADCQTKIFVKRDDKTGVGLSGNKVRKLEFLIADAVQQGCDCVVTIGGGIYGYVCTYIRCKYVYYV